MVGSRTNVRRGIFAASMTCLLVLPVSSMTSVVHPEMPFLGPDRLVSNVSAFARLYGYVRFFYPGDAAADLDWDRFAVHGVAQVRDARTTRELLTALERLFRPVAPLVRVYEAGRDTLSQRDLEGDPGGGGPVIAWQHVGVDLGAEGAPYRSIRLNRPARDILRHSQSEFYQVVDAHSLRGREVRLGASVRMDVRGVWRNRGQLWVRVLGADGRVAFEDGMRDRPIMSARWVRYEVLAPVAADAEQIVVGARLTGVGDMWVDDFSLSVREDGDGPWLPVALANAGFEDVAPSGKIAAWRSRPGDAAPQRDDASPYRGAYAARIRHRRGALDGPLFDAWPRPGEAIDRALGAGLRARVPLALTDSAARAEGTSGRLDTLEATLAGLHPERFTGDELDVRLADVVIVWNVLQHFFPYFDSADTDWERQLGVALAAALDDDAASFHRTLESLVAQLADGHAHAFWFRAPDVGYPPLLFDWVEEHVVVTSSGVDGIRAGDIVLSLDGVPAEQALRRREAYISGSPQWKRRWALTWELGRGRPGTLVDVRVDGPGGVRSVSVPRSPGRRLTELRPEPITELEPGVFYVDLTAAGMPDIRSRLTALATAKGLVLDVRGYPRGNHALLEHLLTRPDTAAAWFRIPRTLYPDRERRAGYEDHGWELTPAEPRIRAKVAFITDSRAISYAESLLGLAEHYGLGEIVGQPTAGANGNINTLFLPGLYQVVFTGALVVKPDGSRFHNIGILPTVRARRTVAGIREGRDELLERAVEIVRTGRP